MYRSTSLINILIHFSDTKVPVIVFNETLRIEKTKSRASNFACS